MRSRAALAGLAIGFAGTVVNGFLVGATFGLFDGLGAFVVGSFFGAVAAGVFFAAPAAVISMALCWVLACAVERRHASDRASRTIFGAAGTVTAPVMAGSSLVVMGIDFAWEWALPLVVVSAVGCGAGLIVWRIASTPPDPWAPAVAPPTL